MRIARAVAATALASAAVGLTASAAFADSAGVKPSTVAPGGTVTISVDCSAHTSNPPQSISASSQAFSAGQVQLHLVAGNQDASFGPTYSGTAQIAGNANFSSNGPNGVGVTSDWSVDGSCPGGSQWNANFTVSRSGTVPHGVHGGLGGSFTDSATTMLTGAVLVVGALGAAYYVVRRRDAEGRG
ncbi:hypothetical protein [Streptomyces sp. NBC_01304]|uniref:hypothetical protein n=1 Tax=Streptomyces sp. NBC_01304 TaxID=2903818 RepID=UPI002E110AA5|nr:hypothetical protein OG430_10350 [Streptomyces sp. NBC_01304]